MTIQSDMALMAAGSYWDVRRGAVNPTTGIDTDNDAPIPVNYKVLTDYDQPGSGPNASSGFSARVYQQGHGVRATGSGLPPCKSQVQP